MKPKRPSKRDIASLCDAVGPEDGLHPDHWTPNDPNRAADRKRRQLAGQIERALFFLLADASDDALHNADVRAVTVAAHGVSVDVTVVAPDSAATEAALARAAAWLRAGVAAAIHRRRTPTLRFTVVPGGEGDDA